MSSAAAAKKREMQARLERRRVKSAQYNKKHYDTVKEHRIEIDELKEEVVLLKRHCGLLAEPESNKKRSAVSSSSSVAGKVTPARVPKDDEETDTDDEVVIGVLNDVLAKRVSMEERVAMADEWKERAQKAEAEVKAWADENARLREKLKKTEEAEIEALEVGVSNSGNSTELRALKEEVKSAARDYAELQAEKKAVEEELRKEKKTGTALTRWNLEKERLKADLARAQAETKATVDKYNRLAEEFDALSPKAAAYDRMMGVAAPVAK